MAERTELMARTVLRIVAAMTLVDIGTSLVGDRYYPAYEHRIAHGSFGTALVLWSVVMPLLLSLYVAIEFWFVHKKKFSPRSVVVDAILAAACLLSLGALALYAFTQYAAI